MELEKNFSDLQNWNPDIYLIIDDDKISAHKIILASASDYFKSMFSGSY